MYDLCQASFSNTIEFDDKPKAMESLCQASISNTIEFDGKPKAMEICAG